MKTQLTALVLAACLIAPGISEAAKPAQSVKKDPNAMRLDTDRAICEFEILNYQSDAKALDRCTLDGSDCGAAKRAALTRHPAIAAPSTLATCLDPKQLPDVVVPLTEARERFNAAVARIILHAATRYEARQALTSAK